MKVLFIFSVGFDTLHSSSIIMSNVIEDCLKKGLEVCYIVPNTTGSDKNYPNLNNNLNEKLSYNVIYQNEIEKKSLIKRYISGVVYALKCIKFIRKIKTDVIYVQSTPTAFWTILVAKFFGKGKIIYSVLDMFPGSTIASGVMPQKWMQIFFTSIQKIAYKMSDQIMCMSEDMKEKLIQQGVPKDKINPFYTWFDGDNLQKIEDKDNSFIKEFNMDKKEKFYVQYAGNVGYVFDTDTFLKVVKKMHNINPNVVFQLVARGNQLDYIEEQKEQWNLDNLEILPLQPVDRIGEVYSACDIQFIPLKKGVMGNSFPSKLAHVMACEKTFICSIDRTYFFNLANKENFGRCEDVGNIDAICNSIIDLYKNKDKLNKFYKNAKFYSEKLCGREKNTSIIINAIKNIGENDE